MSVKVLFFSLLATILFLTGCQSAQPESPTFVEATLDLPGERIYLAQALPEAFEAALKQVYQAHQAGEDVWLFASEDVLGPMDPLGDFRAWLWATRPLLFQSEAGPVYFIPADSEMDRLAFVLDQHLEKWADEAQLSRLWQARGDDLRSERDFEAAIEAYEQALALAPDFSDAYVGLGAALLGLGRSEEALDALLQAAALAPDDYWTQRLLGNAYLNLQRYALAEAPLTRAYLLRPEQPHILIGVALALGRSGRPEQALRVLDEAAQRIDDPKLLGDIQALRKEFSGAAD
jgi:tetratricopeptide (TPR) repeat protein